MRRAASSASASARVGTTIGAPSRSPHVNEAAGVFGLVTVGVAEPLHAPVDIQRERVVVERRRHRACGPKLGNGPRDPRGARGGRASDWPGAES